MKAKILYLISFFLIIVGMESCDTTVDALEIQKPYTYDDQYYQNLRAYKESDHQICFVWFSDYKKTTSLANRFAGLPDSIDIISLWGGIPTLELNPLAYEEMMEYKKLKGVKYVCPVIVRIEDAVAYKDEEFHILFKKSYEPLQPGETVEQKLEQRYKALEMYADYLLDIMWESDTDGLDLDYEPEGDRLSGENFSYFVQYIGGIIGPKSKNPDKLLIIDFYSNTPPSDTEPYTNYFVRQAYTQGFTAHSAARLQTYYNVLSWCPTEKFIVTENIGDHWRTGGSPFTEVDGNTLAKDGEPLFSLEGMARWNPVQGKKGGFGAFYVQRDYNSSSSMPYKYLRRAIQAQNPAVK